MELSNDEKDLLLNAARKSISAKFGSAELPKFDPVVYPKLNETLGAFVTLKINNDLRGCIGYIIGQSRSSILLLKLQSNQHFRIRAFNNSQKKNWKKCKLKYQYYHILHQLIVMMKLKLESTVCCWMKEEGRFYCRRLQRNIITTARNF